jgi:hypothetical protein
VKPVCALGDRDIEQYTIIKILSAHRPANFPSPPP